VKDRAGDQGRSGSGESHQQRADGGTEGRGLLVRQLLRLDTPWGVIVADSALESAVTNGKQPSPPGAMAEDWRSSAGWDVFSQRQRTQQWEADGVQLRRPVDFQAWAAGDWTTPP